MRNEEFVLSDEAKSQKQQILMWTDEDCEFYADFFGGLINNNPAPPPDKDVIDKQKMSFDDFLNNKKTGL